MAANKLGTSLAARAILLDWGERLRAFPWRETLHTLRERFREDRLGLSAGSLTFTTTMALVPSFTVALAIFSAFPIFGELQGGLQRWLVESLVPENIARQVLGYLTQFAGKAGKLGAVGLVVLLVTALALILTIDRTLNNIWRVRRQRPLAQRLLIYWGALTLGPLLLAGSLALTSYAVSSSRGVVSALPGGLRFALDTLEYLLLAGGAALMFFFVPATKVRWPHALAGGLFVATGIELAKKLLGWYLASVPGYSAVYGAFATLPILLVWIYLAWVIVLLGAVVAAYLPSLLKGVARRGGTPGWNFTLAIEVVQHLASVRGSADGMQRRGLTADELAGRMQLSALQIEPAIEALIALDWIGRLADEGDGRAGRHVLLVDTGQTPVEPLAHLLLLHRTAAVRNFWATSRLGEVRLGDLL